MRSAVLSLFAGLFLIANTSVHAQQTVLPAAPQVTVSANLKELVFDWEPVPGAYTYWLLEKLHDRAYFTPIQERMPRTRTRAALALAVHQFNWWQSRYIIAACNSAGCTRSAVIDPLDFMLDTIGYFKASNTDAGDRFGRSLTMSADGTTLAVAAPGESSSATGVNGNQADNSSANSGAVYVFRRTGRRWAQEAYLKGGVNHPEQGFGAPVDTLTRTLAISADGTWLAVGAPAEGPVPARAGAVYLFKRDTLGGWSLFTTLRAPSRIANDQFGFSVDMSQDGRTLKVSSLAPRDGAGNPAGRTHIYVRPGDTWQHSVTLAPYYAGDACPTVRMTGNGKALLAACRASATGDLRAITLRLIGDAWLRVAQFPLRGFKPGQPLAINYHGTRLVIFEGPGQVGRYYWANGAWVLDATYIGSDDEATWSTSLEFDNNGDNFAVSDTISFTAGAGVLRENSCCGNQEGAAYMWQWVEESRPKWQPRPTVKAPNPQFQDLFGTAMALSGNGRIFAVGAPGEDSAARGIDGDRTSETAEDAGAVYLY
jgi:trimeric autotransporter adhesin